MILIVFSFDYLSSKRRRSQTTPIINIIIHSQKYVRFDDSDCHLHRVEHKTRFNFVANTNPKDYAHQHQVLSLLPAAPSKRGTVHHQ